MTGLSLRSIYEPNLPALAWLVSITGVHAKVHHGSGVETWETGFFEGAYAGRWLDDDPSQCPDVFGSGMVIRDGVFHLVTPSHTLEALFVFRRDGVTTASNSLAFLVERLRIDVPVRYDYASKLATLTLGADRYTSRIMTSPIGPIDRVLYDNVELRPDGSVTHRRKPAGQGLSNYASYVTRLEIAIRDVLGNAADSRRGATYTPISTISSGYDSTAVSALGARLGLGESVSVVQARAYGSDSGEEIGRHLGLTVHPYHRRDGTTATFDDLAEFLACGMGGEDYCLLELAARFPGRILLSGFLIQWKPGGIPEHTGQLLARADCAGSGLQELRLRMGFIHAVVPGIAAQHFRDVTRIYGSAEMLPYWTGSGYDKPIPRRIVEEAGVPRHLFGHANKAVSALLFKREGFRSHLQCRNMVLPDTTRDDALARARALGADPSSWRYRRDAAWWVIKRELLKRTLGMRSAKAGKGGPSGGGPSRQQGMVGVMERLDKRLEEESRLHELHMPIMSLMFLVGLDIVRERYRETRAD